MLGCRCPRVQVLLTTSQLYSADCGLQAMCFYSGGKLHVTSRKFLRLLNHDWGLSSVERLAAESSEAVGGCDDETEHSPCTGRIHVHS
jgi:hypothetical protein